MFKYIQNLDLLKFSLSLLNFINLHPLHRKFNIFTLNKFLISFSAFMLFALTITNFIMHHEGVEDFVRKVESICTLMQV